MEIKKLDIDAKKEMEGIKNKNRLIQIAQQHLNRLAAYEAKYGYDSDLIYQRGEWQEYLKFVTNAKTDKDGNIIISESTPSGKKPQRRSGGIGRMPSANTAPVNI